MNLLQSCIKEPLTEIVRYRNEAIKASAHGNNMLAHHWRLAADEAKKFSHQNSLNKFHTSADPSSASNWVLLIQNFLATRRQITPSLESAQQENRNHQWHFASDPNDETASCYRYWIARAKVETSATLETEIIQTLEIIAYYQTKSSEAASLNNPTLTKHLDQAIFFAQEAVKIFKIAQANPITQGISSSIESETLLHRWKTAAYEAIHIANIHVQMATMEVRTDERWNEVPELATQALILRTKAAKATQERDEILALQYSLAAYSANNATDSKLKFLEASQRGEKIVASLWQKISETAENAFKSRVKAIESRSHFWAQAALWLENSSDDRMKATELYLEKNKVTACSWIAAARAAEHTASLWIQSTSIPMMQHEIALIDEVQKKNIFLAEHEAQKKVLSILTQVWFLLPPDQLPTAAQKRAWKEGKIIPDTEYPTYDNWVYQTWMFLKTAGLSCNLTTKEQKEGIVITLGISCLDPSLQSNNFLPENVFLVDIVADQKPHPAAHLYFLQNKMKAQSSPASLFVPHWPQPHLIARDPKHGHRFENIVFFGVSLSLAPELLSKEWQERLHRELGMNFHMRSKDRWHDYSDVDCILAIRNFSESLHLNKPATKLYNAWHAGIPFIGGRDSAYASDGHPGIDYLVATSPDEVLEQLRRLKEDKTFRTALVENGRKSGALFTQESTLERWKTLVQETLPNLALRWQKASKEERQFLMKQHLV